MYILIMCIVYQISQDDVIRKNATDPMLKHQEMDACSEELKIRTGQQVCLKVDYPSMLSTAENHAWSMNSLWNKVK